MDLLDRAWHAFHEAQEIYEESGELVPWAENQLGMARVALRQGNIEYATTLCRRVRGFGRREGLSRIEASGLGVLADVQMADGLHEEAERSLEQSIALFDQLGLARRAHEARLVKILIALESGSVDPASADFAQLRMSPEVDLPGATRMLMQGVGLAIAVDGSADDFQSRLHQVAALTAEIEVATPNLVRCLRLAITRAHEARLPDRAALIEQLAAGLSSARGESGGP